MKRRTGLLPKRVMVSTRVTQTMKKRIDDACASSGRSQAQEIDLRLEQAFLLEELAKAGMAMVAQGGR